MQPSSSPKSWCRCRLDRRAHAVLDRYPDTFFAETEQVAFCPSHLVPGIDFSNDPLLQGRLFSYLDTQLSRLGSANFHQIPINAPKCPFANNQRDGHHQMLQPKGRVAYEPNSLDPFGPRESSQGFRSARAEEHGMRGRVRSETFADHYSQARLFYRSQTKIEQAHIASALVFELSKVEHGHIVETMVGHLRTIDETLGKRVADGLGIALPAAQKPLVKVRDDKPSPALQIIGKMISTLKGRSVGILVADGSHAATIKKAVKAAHDAGATVKIVAPKIAGAKLSDGSMLKADGQLAGTPSVMFDAVVVVLSNKGAAMLANESAAREFVQHAFAHLKAIAVDDGGKQLLDVAGVEPDDAVIDASDMKTFVSAAATRHWHREPSVRALA